MRLGGRNLPLFIFLHKVLPKLLDESDVLERACHTWVISPIFHGLCAAFVNSHNSR